MTLKEYYPTLDDYVHKTREYENKKQKEPKSLDKLTLEYNWITK